MPALLLRGAGSPGALLIGAGSPGALLKGAGSPGGGGYMPAGMPAWAKAKAFIAAGSSVAPEAAACCGVSPIEARTVACIEGARPCGRPAAMASPCRLFFSTSQFLPLVARSHCSARPQTSRPLRPAMAWAG